jgi:hypothetical protein
MLGPDDQPEDWNRWERQRARGVIDTLKQKLIGIHLKPDEYLEIVNYLRAVTHPGVEVKPHPPAYDFLKHPTPPLTTERRIK